MKVWMELAPWPSGCDDEQVDDFILLVEDVLERYFDFQFEKGERLKVAQAKQDDTAAEAKAIQDAAVGNKTAAEICSIRKTNIGSQPLAMSCKNTYVDLSRNLEENSQ